MGGSCQRGGARRGGFGTLEQRCDLRWLAQGGLPKRKAKKQIAVAKPLPRTCFSIATLGSSRTNQRLLGPKPGRDARGFCKEATSRVGHFARTQEAHALPGTHWN